jgi:hypothetical protein
MVTQKRLQEIAESKKRLQEIGESVFDYYVRRRYVEKGFIIFDKDDFTYNERELRIFAKLAKCDKESLLSSLISSMGRINGYTTAPQQSSADETETINAVIKFYVEAINIPLKNYRRDFGNMTAEINRFKPELKLKTQELVEFTYPIYRKVFEGIFRIETVETVE